MFLLLKGDEGKHRLYGFLNALGAFYVEYRVRAIHPSSYKDAALSPQQFRINLLREDIGSLVSHIEGRNIEQVDTTRFHHSGRRGADTPVAQAFCRVDDFFAALAGAERKRKISHGLACLALYRQFRF